MPPPALVVSGAPTVRGEETRVTVSPAPLLSNDPATGSTYTVAADTAVITTWYLSPVSGAEGWTTVGLFYPGCADSDGLGGTVTHNLTQGNSSFPLRGIISHPSGVKSVVVSVSNAFTVSAGCSNAWFDLWELDEAAAFSKLSQGTYTLTIKATNGAGETVTLVSSPLTF